MLKTKNIVFLTAILLFSYQNCSRNNFQPEATQLESLQSSQNLSDMQVQQLKFYIEKDSEMQKGSNTFSVKTTNSYSLDPDNGVLAEHDEASDSLSTYCLTSELLTEVRTIIASSAVCKSSGASADTVCAQVIRNPYAELVTSSEVIRLGYSSDACGSNKVDLCEDQSTVLKQWISKVQNQLSNLSCYK